ncbi:MAG: nitroreductase family protein [Bacteroidales bacterium]|nr:nitroreductase family protein [Bacteroidales bacterium]
MNTFLSLCEARSSVRQFQTTIPDEEAIAYIVECVRLAPSAVNRQPWRIYYTTEPGLLAQLRESYPREWMKEAPAVFVLCKDEAEAWVRPSDRKGHGDIDVAIATEHLCLAATERGLGTCWVCNFDVELCRKALHLSDREIPVVMVPIGYASAEAQNPSKKRKSLSEIYFRR